MNRAAQTSARRHRHPSRFAPEPDRTGPERSAHRLYAQVAWATLDDLPLLDGSTAASLAARLVALCRRLDVEPVAVRVTANRVRLLIRFKPAHALAPLVLSLKAASLDALAVAGRPVTWSRGFVASSVGPAAVRRLAARLRAPS
jgi:REP element-mobilizing transposase RayT